MPEKVIDISIVIPCYNEEKTIANKLLDIYNLDFLKDKLEIIIVDCSTDNTPNIVKAFFETHLEIKHTFFHEDERKGVAHSMNIGKTISSGEIIVRTDSDSSLKKNCLNYVLKAFEDKSVGSVTGMPFPIGSLAEENYRGINTKIQLLETKIDSTIIGHGPFLAFRRNLQFYVKEEFLADDSAINIEIRKLGYRCILDPNIIFYEKTSTTGREEQKVRRASGLIKLLWMNKSMMFNPKYGYYGFIVYPFNFITTTVIPLILSPILIPLIFLNIKGGTIIETQQFLLKGIYRLIVTKKATIHWEKDNAIR